MKALNSTVLLDNISIDPTILNRSFVRANVIAHGLCVQGLEKGWEVCFEEKHLICRNDGNVSYEAVLRDNILAIDSTKSSHE